MHAQVGAKYDGTDFYGPKCNHSFVVYSIRNYWYSGTHYTYRCTFKARVQTILASRLNHAVTSLTMAPVSALQNSLICFLESS